MTPSMQQEFYRGGPAREAVGLFNNMDDLQECVRALEGSEFPRQDISVVGGDLDVDNVFSQKTVNPYTAMDADAVPKDAPVRPEEQTIGMAGLVGAIAYISAIVMALAAAISLVNLPLISAAIIGAAAGAVVGIVAAKFLMNGYKRHVNRQIDQGGLLLWVRTPDSHKEDVAKRLMRKYHGRDIHIHDMAA